MSLIAIVGAGKVGSTTAFSLAQRNFADIVLLDVVKEAAIGEALDLMHADFEPDVKGSDEFKDMNGAKIVVNTAGIPRRPGMDRMDLLNKNREIVSSVAENIKKYAPDSVVIQVSNPLDLMSYVMYKVSGFERERVMGMGGLLDAQRFSFYLGKELKVKLKEIESMVVGEHGESMVPLFSQSYCRGRKVEEILSSEQKERILENTRKAGAEVIGRKGATVFAPVMAITKMVENIMKDKRELLPISCYLDGEYGLNDLCIGVPAILGKGGVEEIVEIDMNELEKKAFFQSAKKLKSTLTSLSY